MQGTLVRRGSAQVSSPTFLDLGNIRPLWLSGDGVTLWCSNGKALIKSTDDLLTFSATIWTLPYSGTNTEIHAIRETADGYLLISAFKLQGNNAGLFRVNPNDGTWTEVLTPSGQAPTFADPATYPSPAGSTGDRSNYFTGWFGFHAYGDGTVIANEYGKQANGTDVPGARYVFMSRSNGVAGSWVQIRDMWSGPPMTTVGNTLPFGSNTYHDHTHGACYDPWRGRVWLTCGDNGHHTEYADLSNPNWPDPGNAHGTWTTTPGSQSQYGGAGGTQQGSTQAATPFVFGSGRVVMGTDGPIDGLVGYDDPSYLYCFHDLHLPHTTALSYTGATPYVRDILSYGPGYAPRFPVVFPFYVGSGTGFSGPAIIVGAEPNGRRFYDIFTDSASHANPYGCFNALGPTARGHLIATLNGDGRAASQVPASYQNMTVVKVDFPVIV